MEKLTLYKAEATRLRKRGLSYNEIRKQVPVAKSTLSLWLKSILLKKEHRERLYTKKIAILCLGSKSQKERRMREVTEIIKKAEEEISLPVSFEAFRLFGAAIYWAEGRKTGSFEITNSDPNLILLMVRWLEKIFEIRPQFLTARLNIYPQQNDSDIKKFWSELTEIPLERFGKSYVKPLSQGYKKNNLYYGTIKIYVPRGTDSRHRVFGWLNAVLKNLDSRVKIVERKWVSLKETARPINLI